MGDGLRRVGLRHGEAEPGRDHGRRGQRSCSALHASWRLQTLWQAWRQAQLVHYGARRCRGQIVGGERHSVLGLGVDGRAAHARGLLASNRGRGLSLGGGSSRRSTERHEVGKQALKVLRVLRPR